MGFLDSILKMGVAEAAPQSGGSIQSALLQHVMGMMTNQQSGGLSGLLGQLKSGGLESQVNSWIGGGPNQPVSGAQIQSALGSGQIEQIAAKLGIPADQVSGHLSQMLPELVNHLTPNGQVPEHSMVQSALGLLKGKLLGS